MANPVNWFHISAPHVEPLAKFYGEAFDWKLKPGPGGMVFAETGEGGIAGGIAPIMDGSDKSTIHIYVDTPDIEAQLARIEKAGGRPAMPKQELPDNMGWISGFIDPANNFVGLWQRPPQALKPVAKRRAPAKKAVAKKAAPKKAAAKKAAPKKTAKKSAKKKK
jgi:predicted enzyme related to lactoylglutathione lyase